MRIYTLYGDEFGELVLGNLANLPNFCMACGLACTECRLACRSFVSDILGVHKAPEDSQRFIDNPLEHLPTRIPNCDLLLAIGIHPDLLAELPSLAERAKARAVIVPIENRKWCPPRLRRDLQTRLEEMGVQSAFPKPFCELEVNGAGVIHQFIDRFRVGKPSLEITVKDDMITNVKVLRSAPCGSTWYVAQQLRWHKIQDMPSLERIVSNAHHGYPCTASMDTDPELGDTILHRSGYIIRNIVKDALTRAHCVQLVTARQV
jgi:hypothetical protein